MGLKKTFLYFIVGFAVGLLVLVAIARLVWHGKYYPGVSVGGVEIAELDREQARANLEETVAHYTLALTFNGVSWQLPKEVIKSEIEESAAAAYRVGRRWQIADYVSVAIGRPQNFPLRVTLDESAINEWVDQITQAVEITPIHARVEINKDKVTVVNGTDGLILDRQRLNQEILTRASQLATNPIEIPMRPVVRQLSEEGLQELRVKGEAIKGDTLELIQDDERIVLEPDKLANFLVDEGVIREYAASLSTLLNRVPQDAKFEFADGRVKEFAPSRDGVEVSVQLTADSIQQSLDKLITESKTEKVEVAVNRTAPKITTDKVNDMGIVERIGRGESYYAHSIANRIYNVGLASSRVNGALVAPGEEFSFNRFVGEISGATGYKTAYVISGGRTVLGDGGGVCQVSTTLFRAVMNAGLPITERWAHAYRVGYYEQNSEPGIDATVYAPSKDFKFVNDTPRHILVQAINDPKNTHLIFEIYGTNDGRVATISKPVVSGVSPPLPAKYEDDPNLPTGTIRQVDWAAWGAKASFDYKVVKADGTPLFEKTYVSNYRPWADVFMRGTAPLSQ